ncbi:MAG: hypothetical protein GY719_08165, partial [bacterium]|nr:hypothetical protein [bacterium]
MPRAKRSWAIRHATAYRKRGFEGLIDTRLPRSPRFSKRCIDIIQAARLANAKLTIDEVLAILADRKIDILPSETTIKREFHKADQRRRYAEKRKAKQHEVVVEELPMAGGELLLAAEIETELMGAVTDELCALSVEAKEASEGRTPARDVERRDPQGRFTAEYNQTRRREDGEQTAAYLRPAADKAADKVPSWPRFVREQRNTLYRKVVTLTLEPLVNPSHGWDGLRVEGVAEALLPLSGFAYMPSTLSKLTSALAQSGAGERLLAVVGVHWHQVAQQQWGEGGALAALYVDNHAKEVGSSLFTRAGKVSHRSRVMPWITTTYVHTGAGTPVW